MKKQLSKSNLEELTSIYSNVEKFKDDVQEIAKENGIEDLYSVVDSLQEAQDELWEIVREFVLKD